MLSETDSIWFVKYKISIKKHNFMDKKAEIGSRNEY